MVSKNEKFTASFFFGIVVRKEKEIWCFNN
jgi:hypothetical protein